MTNATEFEQHLAEIQTIALQLAFARAREQLTSSPDRPSFDKEGRPYLNKVQIGLLPLIEEFGWNVVNAAMYHIPLWALREATGATRRFSGEWAEETEEPANWRWTRIRCFILDAEKT